MNIRIVTMSLGAQQGQFTCEDELNAALAQPGLTSVEKQFFMTEGVARYSFVLTYDAAVVSDSRPSPGWGAGREAKAFGGKGGKPARKYPSQPEVLEAIPAERRGLYDVLREVRNAKAKELGKKGYLLANNYQLAHIACKAPQNMTALRRIHDLGEEFCTTCGEAVLEKVKGLSPVELKAPEGAWWAEEAAGDAPAESSDKQKAAEVKEVAK